jgi:DNA primase catalytic core
VPGRAPTAEQRAVLARWSGWGSFGQLFDKDEYAADRAELQRLLTPEQYMAARRSTTNAHYTDGMLAASIWDGLQRLGFDGGEVLEPGCGSGHFIGLAPDSAVMTGVEREPVSAAIAAALYPNATVVSGSFATIDATEGAWDAAVGNVPFGKVVLTDPKHNTGDHSIHSHFILKALRLTRPGGLVAVLTSHYTMDARNPAARREMANLADLVGAVRLPTGAHRRAAGTEAVTDLLILRRRAEGDLPDTAMPPQAWEKALPIPLGEAEAMVEINRYFLDHPENVLGEFVLAHGMYNAEDLKVAGDLDRLGAQFAAAVHRIADDAVERGMVMTPRTATAPRPATTVSVIDPDAARFVGFLAAHPDGTFTRREKSGDVPFAPPVSEAAELRALLGVRDTAMALIRAEQACIDDTTEIADLRAQLNTVYDDYVATHKPINRFRERMQMRQAWHVFGDWCDRTNVEKLPASPQAVTGYLTWLRLGGLGQDQLQRHLDGLVKAHDTAFGKAVDKAVRKAARDIALRQGTTEPSEVARLEASMRRTDKPESLLRSASVADPRLSPSTVAAGLAIIAAAPAKTDPDFDYDALDLRRAVIIRPPQGGFRDDPFANVARALENFDPITQTARKADVFTQRVINPPHTRLGADTPEEALSICLDIHSRIDLTEIARLLGLPGEPEARAALEGLVFDDPDTGRVVWAPFYLAGNVRQKLASARLAAQDDNRYAANVAALEPVIPVDKGPEEIEVRLGSWIGPEYVEQFLHELLGGEKYRQTADSAPPDPFVRVETVAGLWLVSPNARQTEAIKLAAEQIWAGGGLDAYDLTEKLLIGAPIRVTKTVEVLDRNGEMVEREVLDPEATAEAVDKASEISDKFADWVWEDTTRARDIMRRYNDTFNAEVPVDYSAIELSLPGLSQAFSSTGAKPLREHQKIAVARVIYQGGTGLVHEVGAGKTLEMIIGVMERHRRGLANKPVVVVPNDSIAEQFEREWLQAYPGARLLTGTSADLATKTKGRNRRAEFVARVATGNWDAVIMTKEAFQSIPLPPEIQEQFLSAELDELRAEKTANAAAMSDSMTKRIETAMENAEQRLQRRMDAIPRDTAGITFTDAGFDFVVVDEAQNYKNGLINSAIPDLVIEGSNRAIDLDMKLAHLQDTCGSARVVLATATPWTGKYSEVYLWQRRLGHQMPRFDVWARTYVTQEQYLEMSPGGALRPKTRTRGPINEPELWLSLQLTSDIKMKQDLNLKVPILRDGGIEIIEVPASEQARVFTLDLARRERQLQGKPEKGEDNHLVIGHDGQLGALDLRAVGITTEERQKVDVLAEDIVAEWSAAKNNVYHRDDGTEHPVRGGFIPVFCDESTPSRHWNFYTELREQLLARGMDEGSVRFIHEASSPQRKADMLAACREGAIAVLVGSTMKIGAGINMQTRAIGGYLVSFGWRADIIAQAIGRVERQGNQNPEYFWKAVVLAPSMDAKKLEITLQKNNMFAPLYSSTPPERSRVIDNEQSDSLADMMAAATGDMRYKEKAALDGEYKTLTRQRSSHARKQQALKLSRSRSLERIPLLHTRAEQQDTVAAGLLSTDGDKFSMRIGERTVTKRVDAAQALRERLTALAATAPRTRDGTTIALGVIGGLEITATCYPLRDPASRLVVAFPGAAESTAGFTLDPANLPAGTGPVSRLENQLKLISGAGDRTRREIEQEQEKAHTAATAIGTPFAGEERLDQVVARRSELIALLSEEDDSERDPNEDPNSPEAIARREREEARRLELLALFESARDLAVDAGHSEGAAHDYGSWYAEIAGPVMAEQRPRLETALDVWLSIGRPDATGRTVLAPLGAAPRIPASVPQATETADPDAVGVATPAAAAPTPYAPIGDPDSLAELAEPSTAATAGSRGSLPPPDRDVGVIGRTGRGRPGPRDHEPVDDQPADTSPDLPWQRTGQPAGQIVLGAMEDADTAACWMALQAELATGGWHHHRRDHAGLGGINVDQRVVLTDAGDTTDQELQVLAAHIEDLRELVNTPAAAAQVDAILAADAAHSRGSRTDLARLIVAAGLRGPAARWALDRLQEAGAWLGVAAAAPASDPHLRAPNGDPLRTDADLDTWNNYAGSPITCDNLHILATRTPTGRQAELAPSGGQEPAVWVEVPPSGGEHSDRALATITDAIATAGQHAQLLRDQIVRELARTLPLPPGSRAPDAGSPIPAWQTTDQALRALPAKDPDRVRGQNLLQTAQLYDDIAQAAATGPATLLRPGPPPTRSELDQVPAALTAMARAALVDRQVESARWWGVCVEFGYVDGAFAAMLARHDDPTYHGQRPGHTVTSAPNDPYLLVPIPEDWVTDAEQHHRIVDALTVAVHTAGDLAEDLYRQAAGLAAARPAEPATADLPIADIGVSEQEGAEHDRAETPRADARTPAAAATADTSTVAGEERRDPAAIAAAAASTTDAGQFAARPDPLAALTQIWALNPQHIQWVRRQLVAVAHQSLVWATARSTPDNLDLAVTRALNGAMTQALNMAVRAVGSRTTEPDPAALEVARRYTDDPDFAAAVRDLGVSWVRERVEADRALDLSGLVERLFADLDIEHTDQDTAWICDWIQQAASSERMGQWARANAADQFDPEATDYLQDSAANALLAEMDAGTVRDTVVDSLLGSDPFPGQQFRGMACRWLYDTLRSPAPLPEPTTATPFALPAPQPHTEPGTEASPPAPATAVAQVNEAVAAAAAPVPAADPVDVDVAAVREPPTQGRADASETRTARVLTVHFSVAAGGLILGTDQTDNIGDLLRPQRAGWKWSRVTNSPDGADRAWALPQSHGVRREGRKMDEFHDRIFFRLTQAAGRLVAANFTVRLDVRDLPASTQDRFEAWRLRVLPSPAEIEASQHTTDTVARAFNQVREHADAAFERMATAAPAQLWARFSREHLTDPEQTPGAARAQTWAVLTPVPPAPLTGQTATARLRDTLHDIFLLDSSSYDRHEVYTRAVDGVPVDELPDLIGALAAYGAALRARLARADALGEISRLVDADVVADTLTDLAREIATRAGIALPDDIPHNRPSDPDPQRNPFTIAASLGLARPPGPAVDLVGRDLVRAHRVLTTMPAQAPLGRTVAALYLQCAEQTMTPQRGMSLLGRMRTQQPGISTVVDAQPGPFEVQRPDTNARVPITRVDVTLTGALILRGHDGAGEPVLIRADPDVDYDRTTRRLTARAGTPVTVLGPPDTTEHSPPELTAAAVSVTNDQLPAAALDADHRPAPAVVVDEPAAVATTAESTPGGRGDLARLRFAVAESGYLWVPGPGLESSIDHEFRLIRTTSARDTVQEIQELAGHVAAMQTHRVRRLDLARTVLADLATDDPRHAAAAAMFDRAAEWDVLAGAAADHDGQDSAGFVIPHPQRPVHVEERAVEPVMRYFAQCAQSGLAPSQAQPPRSIGRIPGDHLAWGRVQIRFVADLTDPDDAVYAEFTVPGHDHVRRVLLHPRWLRSGYDIRDALIEVLLDAAIHADDTLRDLLELLDHPVESDIPVRPVTATAPTPREPVAEPLEEPAAEPDGNALFELPAPTHPPADPDPADVVVEQVPPFQWDRAGRELFARAVRECGRALAATEAAGGHNPQAWLTFSVLLRTDPASGLGYSATEQPVYDQIQTWWSQAATAGLGELGYRVDWLPGEPRRSGPRPAIQVDHDTRVITVPPMRTAPVWELMQQVTRGRAEARAAAAADPAQPAVAAADPDAATETAAETPTGTAADLATENAAVPEPGGPPLPVVDPADGEQPTPAAAAVDPDAILSPAMDTEYGVTADHPAVQHVRDAVARAADVPALAGENGRDLVAAEAVADFVAAPEGRDIAVVLGHLLGEPGPAESLIPRWRELDPAVEWPQWSRALRQAAQILGFAGHPDLATRARDVGDLFADRARQAQTTPADRIVGAGAAGVRLVPADHPAVPDLVRQLRRAHNSHSVEEEHRRDATTAVQTAADALAAAATGDLESYLSEVEADRYGGWRSHSVVHELRVLAEVIDEAGYGQPAGSGPLAPAATLRQIADRFSAHLDGSPRTHQVQAEIPEEVPATKQPRAPHQDTDPVERAVRVHTRRAQQADADTEAAERILPDALDAVTRMVTTADPDRVRLAAAAMQAGDRNLALLHVCWALPDTGSIWRGVNPAREVVTSLLSRGDTPGVPPREWARYMITHIDDSAPMLAAGLVAWAAVLRQHDGRADELGEVLRAVRISSIADEIDDVAAAFAQRYGFTLPTAPPLHDQDALFDLDGSGVEHAATPAATEADVAHSIVEPAAAQPANRDADDHRAANAVEDGVVDVPVTTGVWPAGRAVPAALRRDLADVHVELLGELAAAGYTYRRTDTVAAHGIDHEQRTVTTDSLLSLPDEMTALAGLVDQVRLHRHQLAQQTRQLYDTAVAAGLDDQITQEASLLIARAAAWDRLARRTGTAPRSEHDWVIPRERGLMARLLNDGDLPGVLRGFALAAQVGRSPATVMSGLIPADYLTWRGLKVWFESDDKGVRVELAGLDEAAFQTVRLHADWPDHRDPGHLILEVVTDAVTSAGQTADALHGQAQALLRAHTEQPAPAPAAPVWPPLRELRAVAAEHDLAVRVVRVGDRVFAAVHEPAAPRPPVLCLPWQDSHASDGAGRPVSPENILDYLTIYRATVDPALFTTATGIQDWPRRLAQLTPHLLPGPHQRQEIGDSIDDAVRHAADGAPDDAENAVRHAESLAGPLTLTPDREAQVVRAIEDHAAGYAWTHDVGRYLTEPAYLGGSTREWDWINNYVQQHPDVLRQPPAGQIATRNQQEQATAERLAADLNRQAVAAHRAGDHDRALDLVDQAELAHPGLLPRWEKARTTITQAMAESASPATDDNVTGQPVELAPGQDIGQDTVTAPTADMTSATTPTASAPVTTRDGLINQILGDRAGDRDLRALVSVVLSGRSRSGVNLVDATAQLAAADPAIYRCTLTAAAGRPARNNEPWDIPRALAALQRLAENDPTLPINTIGHRVQLTERDPHATRVPLVGPQPTRTVTGVVVEVHPQPAGRLRVIVEREDAGPDDPPRALQDFLIDGSVPHAQTPAAVPLDPQPQTAGSDPAGIPLGAGDTTQPDDTVSADVAGQPQGRPTIVQQASDPILQTQTNDYLLALHAQLNTETALWFDAQLDASPRAQQVLRDRLGDQATVDRIRLRDGADTGGLTIGYAPNGWTGLIDHLRAKGFHDQDLLDGGVATRTRDGRLIDLFRNRIMFAIRDQEGRIAGFTGRTLSTRDEDLKYKYINTSTTPLFDKSTLLLGLWEQRDLAGHADPVVQEGGFDVAAVMAANLTDPARPLLTVAACGTAVTTSHLDALDAVVPVDRRHVFALDPDAGGVKGATRRVGEAAVRRYPDVDITVLPDRLDPAEWALRVDPQQQLASYRGAPHSRPALEVLCDIRVAAWTDGLARGEVESEVGAARSVAALLATVDSALSTDLAVRYALQLHLDPIHMAGYIVEARPVSARATAPVPTPPRAGTPVPLSPPATAGTAATGTSTAPGTVPEPAAVTAGAPDQPASVVEGPGTGQAALAGPWSRRIRIEIVGRTAHVTGTAYGDPPLLRDALLDNGFNWRGKDLGYWEHIFKKKRVPRDDAVAALRAALAVLDSQEAAEAARKAAAKAAAAAGPSYPPTPQQQAIIDACAAGQNVAVRALAGTGKTSTMRMVAARMPDKTITYLAFNRSIADEAQESFGPNVTADTFHALARQALAGHPVYGPKIETLALRDGYAQEIAAALGHGKDDVVPYGRGEQASAVMVVQRAIWAVKKFRESADPELTLRHVIGDDEPDPHGGDDLVLDYARRVWADKIAPVGDAKLPFVHDDYRKIWALGNPTIPGDVIIFDEVQDVNSLQAKLVQAQAAQIIVVGDSYQSIYGFTGARDFLSTWPADVTLPLTQSWRFGPRVAELGNKFLRLIHARLQLEGNPALDTNLGPIDDPDAVLCRTNAAAVGTVIEALDQGTRVALVGGGGEIEKIAKAARDLQRGRPTRHPDLSIFADWAAVEEYCDEHPDEQSLRTFVRMIDHHGPDGLIAMAKQLVSENETDPERAAELVVSTLHKAKGREWDAVRIAADFRAPTEDPDTGETIMPSAEDLRMAYVAVTRAKRRLDLGSLGWIVDVADTTRTQTHAVTGPAQHQAPNPVDDVARMAEAVVAEADQITHAATEQATGNPAAPSPVEPSATPEPPTTAAAAGEDLDSLMEDYDLAVVPDVTDTHDLEQSGWHHSGLVESNEVGYTEVWERGDWSVTVFWTDDQRLLTPIHLQTTCMVLDGDVRPVQGVSSWQEWEVTTAAEFREILTEAGQHGWAEPSPQPGLWWLTPTLTAAVARAGVAAVPGRREVSLADGDPEPEVSGDRWVFADSGDAVPTTPLMPRLYLPTRAAMDRYVLGGYHRDQQYRRLLDSVLGGRVRDGVSAQDALAQLAMVDETVFQRAAVAVAAGRESQPGAGRPRAFHVPAAQIALQRLLDGDPTLVVPAPVAAADLPTQAPAQLDFASVATAAVPTNAATGIGVAPVPPEPTPTEPAVVPDHATVDDTDPVTPSPGQPAPAPVVDAAGALPVRPTGQDVRSVPALQEWASQALHALPREVDGVPTGPVHLAVAIAYSVVTNPRYAADDVAEQVAINAAVPGLTAQRLRQLADLVDELLPEPATQRAAVGTYGQDQPLTGHLRLIGDRIDDLAANPTALLRARAAALFRKLNPDAVLEARHAARAGNPGQANGILGGTLPAGLRERWIDPAALALLRDAFAAHVARLPWDGQQRGQDAITAGLGEQTALAVQALAGAVRDRAGHRDPGGRALRESGAATIADHLDEVADCMALALEITLPGWSAPPARPARPVMHPAPADPTATTAVTDDDLDEDTDLAEQGLLPSDIAVVFRRMRGAEFAAFVLDPDQDSDRSIFRGPAGSPTVRASHEPDPGVFEQLAHRSRGIEILIDGVDQPRHGFVTWARLAIWIEAGLTPQARRQLETAATALAGFHAAEPGFLAIGERQRAQAAMREIEGYLDAAMGPIITTALAAHESGNTRSRRRRPSTAATATDEMLLVEDVSATERAVLDRIGALAGVLPEQQRREVPVSQVSVGDVLAHPAYAGAAFQVKQEPTASDGHVLVSGVLLGQRTDRPGLTVLRVPLLDDGAEPLVSVVAQPASLVAVMQQPPVTLDPQPTSAARPLVAEGLAVPADVDPERFGWERTQTQASGSGAHESWHRDDTELLLTWIGTGDAAGVAAVTVNGQHYPVTTVEVLRAVLTDAGQHGVARFDGTQWTVTAHATEADATDAADAAHDDPSVRLAILDGERGWAFADSGQALPTPGTEQAAPAATNAASSTGARQPTLFDDLAGTTLGVGAPVPSPPAAADPANMPSPAPATAGTATMDTSPRRAGEPVPQPYVDELDDEDDLDTLGTGDQPGDPFERATSAGDRYADLADEETTGTPVDQLAGDMPGQAGLASSGQLISGAELDDEDDLDTLGTGDQPGDPFDRATSAGDRYADLADEETTLVSDAVDTRLPASPATNQPISAPAPDTLGPADEVQPAGVQAVAEAAREPSGRIIAGSTDQPETRPGHSPSGPTRPAVPEQTDRADSVEVTAGHIAPLEMPLPAGPPVVEPDAASPLAQEPVVWTVTGTLLADEALPGDLTTESVATARERSVVAPDDTTTRVRRSSDPCAQEWAHLVARAADLGFTVRTRYDAGDSDIDWAGQVIAVAADREPYQRLTELALLLVEVAVAGTPVRTVPAADLAAHRDGDWKKYRGSLDQDVTDAPAQSVPDPDWLPSRLFGTLVLPVPIQPQEPALAPALTLHATVAGTDEEVSGLPIFAELMREFGVRLEPAPPLVGATVGGGQARHLPQATPTAHTTVAYLAGGHDNNGGRRPAAPLGRAGLGMPTGTGDRPDRRRPPDDSAAGWRGRPPR